MPWHRATANEIERDQVMALRAVEQVKMAAAVQHGLAGLTDPLS
jgi:hypothetical protein